MMPNMQVSDATKSSGGAIGGNTINFGGIRPGGGSMDSVMQYWPLLLGGAVLLALILRKK